MQETVHGGGIRVMGLVDLEDPGFHAETADGADELGEGQREHVDAGAFNGQNRNDDGGWSVLLHGTAEVISDEAELARCEKMPLRPWVPTVKTHYVRIRPDRVSGRQFAFGPEPETSSVPPARSRLRRKSWCSRRLSHQRHACGLPPPGTGY